MYSSLSSSPVRSESNTRLLQIDVLRGFAALGVFVFHVSGSAGFPKRTLPPIHVLGTTFDNIPSFLSFGATGVNLFFVISGFCLALKPLGRGVSTIEYRTYALDRLSRVYPAYLVAVLFSLLIELFVKSGFSLTDVLVHVFFLQGLVQQWHFGLNPPLWSMATEMQFYAIFPFAFALLRHLGPNVFVFSTLLAVVLYRICCTALSNADVLVGGINTSTFLMNALPGRLAEFVLGMCLAQAWLTRRERLAQWCRLALLPALLSGLMVRMRGPGWLVDPVLAIMYAAIVGWLATVHLGLTDKSWLVLFGRSSYSFFLLHQPILELIMALGWLDALPLYEKFFTLALLGAAATLPCSTLLYRYVEIHCQQYFRSRSTGRPSGSLLEV